MAIPSRPYQCHAGDNGLFWDRSAPASGYRGHWTCNPFLPEPPFQGL
jgi:hypothetical protein